jgi:NAD(P)-dependent dehydrogenase (short-subunit alcohol dehydrogenase family)
MAPDPQFTRYASLAGKVVVITGGASGIGATLVAAFAAQDASVHFLDIDEARGQAVADATPRARFHACNLLDIAALRAVIARIEAEESRIDVLVNNAANDERHAMESVEPEYWRERLAVNLDHQFFATQAVAAGMRARGSGAIIMTSSASWMKRRPGMVAYTTAKSAVIGLTRTLARELGPGGIRVNCIVPGAILTERQATRWRTPELEQKLLEEQCLPILLDANHVARATLFLASDDAAGCTGTQLIVDAGLT